MADPVELTRLVRELTVETQRYVDAVSRALGLHRSDVTALGILIDAGRTGTDGDGMTPTMLAADLGMSQAAVSALVDRLEHVGHLRRRRGVTDRRTFMLDVSATARDTSARMFAPLTQGMRTALEGYTDAELDLAAQVLADLVEATHRARPPATDSSGSDQGSAARDQGSAAESAARDQGSAAESAARDQGSGASDQASATSDEGSTHETALPEPGRAR